MKKIISLALIGATTSLMAMYAEHASLYKDPRVMGMGGASVAVGAYSSSVFSNPAGLTNIKKDHGFVVDLLGIGLSVSPSIADFLGDFSDTNGDVTLIGDVLQEFAGEQYHVGFDNYSSISKNSDIFAWSIGVLAAGDFNFMAHSDMSLTTTSRAYGGLVLGIAKPYETEYGQLDVGMSVKVIQLQSYEDTLSATDLIGTDDLMADVQDRLESTQGIGIDLGVTYKPWADNFWHPAFGVSIMNIGSMDMGGVYGGQPMTLNFGASITPELPILDKFTLAVDYVDALNANQLRMYNSDGTYVDYDESDIMKRLRVGVGFGLLDTWLLSTTLNLGLYQAAYTAGVNIELALFKLNVATYQENVGSTATPIEDRRYMVQLGLGW